MQSSERHIKFWCDDGSWYGNHNGGRVVINRDRSASDVNIVSGAQIEGNGDIDRVRGCLITTCKSNNVLNCIEKELACKATILAKNTRFPHRLCIL